MKSRLPYFLLATAAAAAVVFFVMRQRELTDLRAANTTLRQQLDARDADAVRPTSATPTVADTPGALSPSERDELLRLRGQIQPLRRELATLSNSVPASR